ncbi:MAG: hypothetical protein J1E82_04875 [Muribaculaceae bacterium]|nr:hypothetical protein [Muribaculaceae bacterium]
MIRVYKHNVTPSSLLITKAYDGEDVKIQLLSDQHDKCYLCERYLVTDFEIEHHKSKDNYPHLIQNWNNLFLVCRYCNGKKSKNYDDTLYPVTINIEEEIRQIIDFDNKQAKFEALSDPSSQHTNTIDLLNKIFNGKDKIRKIKEKKFFDYIVSIVNDFSQLIRDFQKSPSITTKNLIIEALQINKEMLGFKYWMIKSNEDLLKEFGEYIIWNKTA